jgi:hypothetical protein
MSKKFVTNFFGGNGEEVTPVPIPNTEVKLFSADGTAWEAVWESRTPPENFYKPGTDIIGSGFFYACRSVPLKYPVRIRPARGPMPFSAAFTHARHLQSFLPYDMYPINISIKISIFPLYLPPRANQDDTQAAENPHHHQCGDSVGFWHGHG